MAGQVEEVSIRVGLGPQARPERVVEATAKLRRELRRLPVERVSPISAGPPPDGARAGDALELGALVVAIARSPGLIEALGGFLSDWMAARNNRSVVVQRGDDRIELTGVSRDDQTRLAQLFEDQVRQE